MSSRIWILIIINREFIQILDEYPPNIRNYSHNLWFDQPISSRYPLNQPNIGIIATHLSHYWSHLSTGERPFIDILQDRRYWVIHLITIPSLFLAGVIFLDSPFVYKLFGLPSFNQYFYKDNTLRQISLIKDRFSSLNEISDIQHQCSWCLSFYGPLPFWNGLWVMGTYLMGHEIQVFLVYKCGSNCGVYSK